MFGWGDSQVCPIGVDVGTGCIKLLQLRRKADQFVLQAAARAELPPPAGETEAERGPVVSALLRKLLGGADFIGRRGVTALSAEQMHVKSVRLPPMPETDLDQAIHWEARDRFGFDLAGGGLAYFRAGEVRRGTEVRDELLLFAATDEVLRGHIGQLSAAGLRIGAIDLQPCAMLRALRRTGGSEAGRLRAVADVGQGGTHFVIAQDDRITFYKHVEIGTGTLNAAVAQKLGVSVPEAAQIRVRVAHAAADGQDPSEHLRQAVADAVRPALEDLARELDMCMRYYVVTFRATRPEAIELAGGGGHCPRVSETIAGVLGLRVNPAQPLWGVAQLNEATRPDRSADWAVAAGLSLYGGLAARVEEAA